MNQGYNFKMNIEGEQCDIFGELFWFRKDETIAQYLSEILITGKGTA